MPNAIQHDIIVPLPVAANAILCIVDLYEDGVVAIDREATEVQYESRR